ncbi:TlpA family protein disulfide reductase [Niabella sp. CC-SYL272]|uniref:TlpA family protein disulfide reductase n=1 Tax=Niabella agricola TaxID=2891571 RepID=UPI001F386885|nr:TlpA disulfide reductase family protein [Niabella agricola]MCF3111272.1 TlpA family protein disulfide reductase [Niabella agricola]
MKLNTIILMISLGMSALTACKNQGKQDTADSTAPVATDTAAVAPNVEANTAPATPAVSMMPAFKMSDERGQPVTLESLKGKKVVFNIWASWCPPCRAEMPSIQNLYKKLDKKKVAFVLLSVDENREDAATFKKKQNLNMPVFFPAENLPLLFNVQAIPSTFIFNEKGELIKKMEGMDDYDKQEYVDLLKG